MYYIYLDESDTKGAYYSNFYGGIIIPSKHHAEFIDRIQRIADEVGIKEEIKWQKVTAFTFDKYIHIIDELFKFRKFLKCVSVRILS